MWARTDDDENQIKKLFDQCENGLVKSMNSLHAKLEKISAERDMIIAKESIGKSTAAEHTNLEILNDKVHILDCTYRNIYACIFSIKDANNNFSDTDKAKEYLINQLNMVVNAINNAKETRQWENVKNHRGFLGVIDSVLKFIFGEIGRIKTASERVVDNAASTINKVRPK